MTGGILDPDGARERLTAWKNRIDRLAADTQAMSDRLQQVRITAADPAGLVEVTIDSTGALVDIRLTDRIQRTAPDAVSRAIIATLGDARGKLADRSQEIIEDTVGTDSPAARAIAESVGRQLRGGEQPQRAVPQGDEDFDIRSHLRRD
jgi:DNA-binding protein YbaB